jgi:hypothetical protein
MAAGVRFPLLACAMLTVAACGLPVESTFELVSHPPAATGTGEASTPSASVSFDVSRVQANFSAHCAEDPVAWFGDELFCAQVKISELTGTGKILMVPTTLHAGAFDRASSICHQVAVANYDDTGVPLRYVGIEVLDQAGDYLADCRIVPA